LFDVAVWVGLFNDSSSQEYVAVVENGSLSGSDGPLRCLEVDLHAIPSQRCDPSQGGLMLMTDLHRTAQG
jgi:hypothetical protein